MVTLVHFSHKIPLYDWHWTFWLPSDESSPKTKEKKMPLYTKQESKKCRDVDPSFVAK
jgi:hypothetical protein